MEKTILRAAAAAAFVFAPLVTSAAERKKADIECKPTEEKLVYDCMIKVKGSKSGDPLDGARFMVGADMPSMPAAHNVKPVEAEPTGEKGEYRAKLHLEMLGEWALKLDFTKPNRDRVVKKLHFGSLGSGEKMHHRGSHGQEQNDSKTQEQ